VTPGDLNVSVPVAAAPAAGLLGRQPWVAFAALLMVRIGRVLFSVAFGTVTSLETIAAPARSGFRCCFRGTGQPTPSSRGAFALEGFLPPGRTPCIGRRDHHPLLPASGRPRLLGEDFLTGEAPVRRPVPVVAVRGRRLSV
jgi:hypothetical protein